MLGQFKPYTVQMIFGQPIMDAAVEKRSLYEELNKFMNWGSIRQMLLEIYHVGK